MNTNNTNPAPLNPSNLNGHPNGHGTMPLPQPVIAPSLNDVPSPSAPDTSPDASGAKPSLKRRLAAQKRAAAQAARGLSEQHDPLTRSRDKWGNPVPRVEVFLAPPATDDKPLQETPLQGALDVVAAHSPGRAAWLHHFYNHRVLPALERVQDVSREEWERLFKANAEVERLNAALAARQADLETERDDATRADREAILALDGPVSKAHSIAADRVSKAGGSYAPQNPSEGCVLRHERLDERAIAGREGICFPEDNARVKLSHTTALVLSGLVGTMIGTSVGIIAGVLHAARLGSELPQLGACAALGTGAALAGGRWVKGIFYESANLRAQGKPTSSWAPALALGVLAGAAIVGLEAVVEQMGLLKLAALQNAFGGAHAGGGVYLAVGMLFALPYIGAYAYTGWAEGTNAGSLNRIRAIRETEFLALDSEVRSRPAVQSALEAIAGVVDLNRQKGALEARIAKAAAPFDAEIAACESGKREPQRELETSARWRIQDAYDNWNGAHLLFDRQFEEALEAAEPGQHGLHVGQPGPGEGGTGAAHQHPEAA